MVVREQRFSFNEVRQALGAVLGEDLHAKRVDLLKSGATLGVLRSASPAVCAIGQGLAAARGLKPKYAVKQVDRLLSNPKINVDDILGRWVPYVVGARTSIVVALDWTDFDADRQATIMLSLITDHGPRHPPGLAHRRQAHPERPPQPLRASRAGAPGRAAAGRHQGLRGRRPRVR